ncbi:MAG TPA: hypothetical protein ENN64_00235, partial [bacterium]|nr:hypothetical protein [bacterium]
MGSQARLLLQATTALQFGQVTLSALLLGNRLLGELYAQIMPQRVAAAELEATQQEKGSVRSKPRKSIYSPKQRTEMNSSVQSDKSQIMTENQESVLLQAESTTITEAEQQRIENSVRERFNDDDAIVTNILTDGEGNMYAVIDLDPSGLTEDPDLMIQITQQGNSYILDDNQTVLSPMGLAVEAMQQSSIRNLDTDNITVRSICSESSDSALRVSYDLDGSQSQDFLLIRDSTQGSYTKLDITNPQDNYIYDPTSNILRRMVGEKTTIIRVDGSNFTLTDDNVSRTEFEESITYTRGWFGANIDELRRESGDNQYLARILNRLESYDTNRNREIEFLIHGDGSSVRQQREIYDQLISEGSFNGGKLQFMAAFAEVLRLHSRQGVSISDAIAQVKRDFVDHGVNLSEQRDIGEFLRVSTQPVTSTITDVRNFRNLSSVSIGEQTLEFVNPVTTPVTTTPVPESTPPTLTGGEPLPPELELEGGSFSGTGVAILGVNILTLAAAGYLYCKGKKDRKVLEAEIAALKRQLPSSSLSSQSSSASVGAASYYGEINPADIDPTNEVEINRLIAYLDRIELEIHLIPEDPDNQVRLRALIEFYQRVVNNIHLNEELERRKIFIHPTIPEGTIRQGENIYSSGRHFIGLLEPQRNTKDDEMALIFNGNSSVCIGNCRCPLLIKDKAKGRIAYASKRIEITDQAYTRIGFSSETLLVQDNSILRIEDSQGEIILTDNSKATGKNVRKISASENAECYTDTVSECSWNAAGLLVLAIIPPIERLQGRNTRNIYFPIKSSGITFGTQFMARNLFGEKKLITLQRDETTGMVSIEHEEAVVEQREALKLYKSELEELIEQIKTIEQLKTIVNTTKTIQDFISQVQERRRLITETIFAPYIIETESLSLEMFEKFLKFETALEEAIQSEDPKKVAENWLERECVRREIIIDYTDEFAQTSTLKLEDDY